MKRRALITGGEGTLAHALGDALRAGGRYDEVLTPGRAELDVSDAEAVSEFFSGLDRIDLLINNAGTTRDGAFLKMPTADWDAVTDANLKGAFLCSREAIRLMFRQREGHIVNVGSYSALNPHLGQVNYAAAKAALIGLTQSLSEEVGKRNVRVNCVLPGFLEGTGITNDLSEAVIEKARDSHTLGRFNTVESAARFVAFLDAEMDAVSGQVFQLDSRLRRW